MKGTPFSQETKIYTSVFDLMRDVRTEALHPLIYPSAYSYITMPVLP
jgi:hypothetical protein